MWSGAADPRSHAVRLFNRDDEYPAVPSLARSGGVNHRPDDVFGEIVVDHDVDHHLRQVAKLLRGAAIDHRGVWRLASAADLRDGETRDIELFERVGCLFHFVRSDNAFN